MCDSEASATRRTPQVDVERLAVPLAEATGDHDRIDLSVDLPYALRRRDNDVRALTRRRGVPDEFLCGFERGGAVRREHGRCRWRKTGGFLGAGGNRAAPDGWGIGG
jgi:hypothetical protein